MSGKTAESQQRGLSLSAFIFERRKNMISIIDTLPENWETDLELHLLRNHTNRNNRKVYICSPCNADTPEGIQRNMRAARLYMYYAAKKLRFNARAPHAFLPVLLSDKIPAERGRALRFGSDFIENNETFLICGSDITAGMSGEIGTVSLLSMPIMVYNEDLLLRVRKIVTRIGADKSLVTYNANHPVLGMSPEELFSPSRPNRSRRPDELFDF